jgi:DNA polymerase III subunit epsilon
MNLATVLHLERPLAVLDVETTGTNPEQDRIVQIAVTIHYPAKDPIPWSGYVNPIIPIPPESTAVHHIDAATVKDAPTFRTMAPKLAKALTGVDFCGYNVTFDLKTIFIEMKRAGVPWSYEGAAIIDAFRIFQILEPRSLEAAHVKYCGAAFEGAHGAAADVAATEAVLDGQLRMYPNDIPRDVKRLAEYCWPKDPNTVDASGKFAWKNGEAIVAFGKKFYGTPLRQVDKGFLQWMIDNDFPADAKFVAAEALEGRYPTKA